MLKSGVVLFLIPMPIAFEKHFTPVEDIVDILCCRGLNIDNYDEALHLLTNIGYYRFSAYLYPLLETPKCNHQFKTNSSFNNALSLYCFDKQLRMLIFSEIESIEIAFRSVLANRIADKTGDIFWMTNASMYKDENRFANTMLLLNKELKVSKEDFIKHFKSKYSNLYPPAWMLVEILPLGTLTRIYENISDGSLRKLIAFEFSLSVPVFCSWMTTITLLRNACCHHARVWNKKNAILPMIVRKPMRPWLKSYVDISRTFYNLCIIKWFVNVISPTNDMRYQLEALLNSFPNVDINAMGFPNNWGGEPLWN
ncbi:MAG: Abi family protein [Bacteroidales bacterium]|nr:Abi family protein [Bacteroidales bacterium]MBO5978311.1 Abi family protein [Bacteroidales bacterium]MBO7325253.1 Abi family protein [Bacteroidales bacterium]